MGMEVPRGPLSSTPRPPVTGLPVPWGRARDPADAGGAREAGGGAGLCCVAVTRVPLREHGWTPTAPGRSRLR